MHTAFNLQKPLAFMAFMAFIACNRSLFGERSKLQHQPSTQTHAGILLRPGGCFKTASRFKVLHLGIAAVLGDYVAGNPHICTTWHLKAFIAFMAFIAFIACCSQFPQAMAPSKPAMHEPMQDPARMCHQAGKDTTSATLPRDSLQQPGKQSVQHGCSVPCGPSLPSCSSSRELPRHPPSSSWPLATVAKASTDRRSQRSLSHHETV